MLFVNPCLPFLRPETVVRGMEAARTIAGYATSVFAHRGLVWDEARRLVIGDDSLLINTKTNPLFYVPAHVLECNPGWG